MLARSGSPGPLRPDQARGIQGLPEPGRGGRHALPSPGLQPSVSAAPSSPSQSREQSPAQARHAGGGARPLRARGARHLPRHGGGVGRAPHHRAGGRQGPRAGADPQAARPRDGRPAHSLGQRLGLLGDELRRLSQRSEVDLRDQDLAPEKSLLQLSHERSAFFNVGVAILDRSGEVVWSEPQAFLDRGASFATERWFGGLQESPTPHIVPVQPDRPDSVLYVVSPLIKGTEFTGALLGAVDLARGQPLTADPGASRLLTVVATMDGQVVYPPVPPPFASERAWRSLFTQRGPFTASIVLEGVPSLAAASTVAGSELVLLSLGKESDLFLESRSRLRTRLVAGLSLALLPAVLLLLLLRRSFKLFRKSEEEAVREERLRLLGEAANSIAHEVKNALNGLSMGLDLVVRSAGDPTSARPTLAPFPQPPPSRPGAGPVSRGPIPASAARARRERAAARDPAPLRSSRPS